MCVAEKTLEVSFLCDEFESKTLVITVPKDYKESASSRSSLSVSSKHTTPFTEVKNSLHGFKTSLKHEMETEVASGCSP